MVQDRVELTALGRHPVRHVRFERQLEFVRPLFVELVERPDKRFLAPVQIRHALAGHEGEQRIEPHGEQPCPCSAAARRDGDRCFFEIERAHGLVQDAKPASLEVGSVLTKGHRVGCIARFADRASHCVHFAGCV